MRGADRNAPDRIQRLAATSPEMKAALEGYRFITPHVEYHDKMTINLGGRTIEIMYLKGVHSEADSAVWLPKERIVFSASAYGQPGQYSSSLRHHSGHSGCRENDEGAEP